MTFNKGGTNAKNYYEEISYQFINGYLFVTPEINGLKRKFLFDTGAPTQITPKLFNELKSAVINRTKITDISGNKDYLDIVDLKEIKLNNLAFMGVPALVSNSDIYTCMHIDGVIGSNLLRNSIVRIEPTKQVIILTDDATKLPLDKKKATSLVTGEPQSYPYLMMEVTGKQPQMIGFDSGSPYFLVMAETHAKRFIKDNTFETLSTGFGSSSRGLLGLQKEDSLYRLRLPSISIAKAVFTNVITETNKSNKTRVGAKLLNYGVVTMDFIHHLFYFEPINENNDLSEKLWPLKPVAVNNKLLVGVVWGEFKNEANPGDQIIAIDDEPCETMDLCEWLDGKSAVMMNKPTVVFSIKDAKGNIKKINLIKE